MSDYLDGLNFQCFTSVIFMFFAAFAPAITFGGLLGERGSVVGAEVIMCWYRELHAQSDGHNGDAGGAVPLRHHLGPLLRSAAHDHVRNRPRPNLRVQPIRGPPSLPYSPVLPSPYPPLPGIGSSATSSTCPS